MATAAKASRVGILLECGRDGLEIHLCRRICALLRDQHGAHIEEMLVPLDNKKRLIEECATVAGNLLRAEDCERVVILWDERPAWPRKEEDLCWHRERAQILGALEGAGLQKEPVFLVCIEREFESWLLFDERMLSAVLSRRTHAVKVPPQKNPHRLPNPKGTMMSLFRKYGHSRYVDVQIATRLATALPDLSRLGKCHSFQRFVERVTGPQSAK